MVTNSNMMFQINIDHSNPMEIVAQMEALEQSLDATLTSLAYQAVEIFEDEIEKEIDNQDLIDTGRMKGSIYSMVNEAFNGYWDTVGYSGVTPYYAYYLEYGTVNHRAYKFMRIAFTRAYPQIVSLFYSQISSTLQASQLFQSGW